MDRVDVAMREAWVRAVQLHLGGESVQADPAAADAMHSTLKTAHEKRADGTLDDEAFVRWAIKRVPWLARALGDVPEPPRRQWVRPSAPPAVPAPTPAHAAVADKIVRGDVARRGGARYTGRGGDHD